MNDLADIAVAGLAVMGENLALNLESRGYRVAVYNRSSEKTKAFLADKGRGKNFIGSYSLKELSDSLKKPRKIIMMIKAGQAVDDMITGLQPLLSPGDILVDGGNSLFTDTEKRLASIKESGILYLGCGISGGEEGALKGPSLMPGGDQAAWPALKPYLETIAAKAPNGDPCCRWMGPGGAGHFVKMVHNGIEYAYMQIISEIYQLLRDLFQVKGPVMETLFKNWNSGDLESYLMEITGKVLQARDPDGEPLVNRIVDSAGQKGTGRWTVEAALTEGVPLGVITEAVYFRAFSADRELRSSGNVLKMKTGSNSINIEPWQSRLADALLLGQILSFAQGFSLISKKSQKENWGVPLGEVAEIWRGGCIIRSALLDRMALSFREEPHAVSLLSTKAFSKIVTDKAEALRDVVVLSIEKGIPVPGLSSALQYLTALTSGKTGINLLQAQRDYFGAHTFERTDRPFGEYHHWDWASFS